MTAIRVIFDGKAFVPQEPVSLPAQSEALAIVDGSDPAAQAQLDAEVRAYYERAGEQGDADDEAWGKATSPQSSRAWDEDRPMAGFPRRGEVWLVDFPDDPKLRPARTHVPLPAGHGGLAHDSMADLRERQLSPQVPPRPRPAGGDHQPRVDAQG